MNVNYFNTFNPMQQYIAALVTCRCGRRSNIVLPLIEDSPKPSEDFIQRLLMSNHGKGYMSTSCHSSGHFHDKKYISIYQVKCEGAHHLKKKKRLPKKSEAPGVGKKIKLRVESVKMGLGTRLGTRGTASHVQTLRTLHSLYFPSNYSKRLVPGGFWWWMTMHYYKRQVPWLMIDSRPRSNTHCVSSDSNLVQNSNLLGFKIITQFFVFSKNTSCQFFCCSFYIVYVILIR